MHRRPFPQIAAIVVLGLAALVYWVQVHQPGGSARSDAAAGSETLFQRFVIAPGGDASALPLTLDGARLVEIDRTGALLVHNAAGVRRQPQPRAYQDVDGIRRDVSVRFDIAAGGDVRFKVGPYDRTLPLVIDPSH